ncbi:MAG: hypothetical protein JW840_06270 [Candidatus Thermoplasmatota archaeon]|nr:hypothetical protein [Candidatus Thermoplasmatota archaeon]
MDKKPLIVINLCAVVFLVLGSLTNCLRIENVQSCDCGDPPCWPVLNGTMGNNNWYISSVTLAFNGSITVHYRIDGGTWQTYSAPLVLTFDGIHLLEWTCDNSSEIYSIEIKIDKTAPILNLNYTWMMKYWRAYVIILTATAIDTCSGMNRTEFNINNILQETIIGPGPTYEYRFPWYYTDRYKVRGFILNPKITDSYVKFYSLFVVVSVFDFQNSAYCYRATSYDNAGWSTSMTIENPCRPVSMVPGFYLFQGVILPKTYSGHIGPFFITATFYGSIEGNK